MENKIPNINQKNFNKSMRRLYNKALIEYGKPDIIYAHFYRGAISAIDFAKKDNIPIVVMEHSGELMKPFIPNKESKALRKAVEESAVYIATTENLKRNIIKHSCTKKDILVIPNIVDDMFSYYERNDKSFTFLSVSRLTYDKRIDLLIDAFCKAFDSNENVSLRIGGQGYEYSALISKVEKAGRSNQIHFLGQLSRNDVLEEMKSCSCFVLPSRHETFGIVWREALCIGRPVITTDHGGFSDKDWNDSYGIMISVDNLDELVEALLSIKSKYNSYNLSDISSKNRNMYSGSHIGKEVIAIMNKCLEVKEK